MAETPLGRLARLLGGVILMQGRLGHQILGQLLVYDTDEAAIAGATVVIAATTRQRNAIAQAAIRTAAPAIAVRGILHRDLKRLEAREALLAERLRRIDERDEALAKRERDHDSGRTSLVAARHQLAPRVLRDAWQRIAELEKEKAALAASKPVPEAPVKRVRRKAASPAPAATVVAKPTVVAQPEPAKQTRPRRQRAKAGKAQKKPGPRTRH